MGNKYDIANRRAVGYSTAQAFADSLGVPRFETSAKDVTNVEQAFLAMATQIKGRTRSAMLEPGSNANKGTLHVALGQNLAKVQGSVECC